MIKNKKYKMNKFRKMLNKKKCDVYKVFKSKIKL